MKIAFIHGALAKRPVPGCCGSFRNCGSHDFLPAVQRRPNARQSPARIYGHFNQILLQTICDSLLLLVQAARLYFHKIITHHDFSSADRVVAGLQRSLLSGSVGSKSIS
jgi:hypothetical protein